MKPTIRAVILAAILPVFSGCSSLTSRGVVGEGNVLASPRIPDTRIRVERGLAHLGSGVAKVTIEDHFSGESRTGLSEAHEFASPDGSRRLVLLIVDAGPDREFMPGFVARDLDRGLERAEYRAGARRFYRVSTREGDFLYDHVRTLATSGKTVLQVSYGERAAGMRSGGEPAGVAEALRSLHERAGRAFGFAERDAD